MGGKKKAYAQLLDDGEGAVQLQGEALGSKVLSGYAWE